jgi:hypothetical protein
MCLACSTGATGTSSRAELAGEFGVSRERVRHIEVITRKRAVHRSLHPRNFASPAGSLSHALHMQSDPKFHNEIGAPIPRDAAHNPVPKRICASWFGAPRCFNGPRSKAHTRSPRLGHRYTRLCLSFQLRWRGKPPRTVVMGTFYVNRITRKRAVYRAPHLAIHPRNFASPVGSLSHALKMQSDPKFHNEIGAPILRDAAHSPVPKRICASWFGAPRCLNGPPVHGTHEPSTAPKSGRTFSFMSCLEPAGVIEWGGLVHIRQALNG